MIKTASIARRSAHTSLRAVAPVSRRSFTTSASAFRPSPGDASNALGSRWLSDLHAQMRASSKMRLSYEAKRTLGEVRGTLETRWLELLAGSEGFITDEESRGLSNHRIHWGDMDAMVCHVNNIMYNRYAESARVNWVDVQAMSASPETQPLWRELMSPRNIGLIMRSIKTDYKFPLTHPDKITVLHKLTTRPDASADHLKLEAVIISETHRRVAARCFEDIVVYDYKNAKKTTLPPFMVEKLQGTFDAQEEAKKINVTAAKQLVDTVANVARP